MMIIETYEIQQVLRDLYGDTHQIVLEVFRQEHLAWEYLEKRKTTGSELVLIKKTETLLAHENKKET